MKVINNSFERLSLTVRKTISQIKVQNLNSISTTGDPSYMCYMNNFISSCELIARKIKLKETRRLKSFPWDALIYGSIMAFYLNLEKLGKLERCVML